MSMISSLLASMICIIFRSVCRGIGELLWHMKRYNTMSEIPGWAKPSVKKLCLNGKLNGKSGQKDSQGYPMDLDLSDDMLRLVVMLT